jgi:hypothetical protein
MISASTRIHDIVANKNVISRREGTTILDAIGKVRNATEWIATLAFNTRLGAHNIVTLDWNGISNLDQVIIDPVRIVTSKIQARITVYLDNCKAVNRRRAL